MEFKKVRLLFLSALMLLLFAVLVNSNASVAANSGDIKVLTLKQNQYVLGEVTVQISKDSFKVYNAQNDVTILITPDRKVREFSLGRKILFERSLDDFLKKGSTANWDYDENLVKLPWFPVAQGKFQNRPVSGFICPYNAGFISRLTREGKKVDLKKHEMAHYNLITLPPGYMKEAPLILSTLYRFPYKGNLPVELQCNYQDDGTERPFWQQERGSGRREPVKRGIRKYLFTRSIEEGTVDAKTFEFKGGLKLAKEESEVYLSKETNNMLENMFAPDERRIDGPRSPKTR